MTVSMELDGVRITGARGDGVTVFAGLRYAGVPSGARRLTPPEPGRWPPGPVDAISFAPAAPQAPRSHSQLLHGPVPVTGEDCLALNVWVPAVRQGPLPVLAWIHGGAFLSGHTSAPCYQAWELARRGGLVVVTIGYRLGSLGWLRHPGLAASVGAPSANWGLLDIEAAVKWVGRNIAAFGGDPGRVTVAGQSAGALCALLLMSSPRMRGLIHRVIAQSPVLVAAAPTDADRWAGAVLRHLGASQALPSGRGGRNGCGAEVAALRRVPAQALVDADTAVSARPEFRGLARGPFPCADGVTVAWGPDDERAAVAMPDVPVLIGYTKNEGSFFHAELRMTQDSLQARVARLAPGIDAVEVIAAARARLADQAPLAGQAAADGPEAVYAEVWTRLRFQDPIRRWAGRRRQRVPAPAFVYEFAHRSPLAGLGAAHTLDVPLVFGTHRHPSLQDFCGRGPAVDRVSEQMIATWAAFAADGRPTTPGFGPWPEDATVVIGSAPDCGLE